MPFIYENSPDSYSYKRILKHRPRDVRKAAEKVLSSAKKRQALFRGREVPHKSIYFQIYAEDANDVVLAADGWPMFRLNPNDWGMIIDEITE